jgi:hypothetical protein
MLCTVCSSIDLDELASKKTLEHHKSIRDLDSAARNGCDLCRGLSELYRELLGLQDDVEEHGETGKGDEGHEWWQRDWGQILFGVEGLGQAGGYPLENDVVFWQPNGSGEWDGLSVKLTCCTTQGTLKKALRAEFKS